MDRLEPAKSGGSLLGQPGKRPETKRTRIMETQHKQRSKKALEHIQGNSVRRH